MLGSMFIILLLILVAKSINHSVDAFSSTRQLDEYDNQNELKITLMPEIKAVIINIGSNIDPPMPPEDDDSIAVIAVEPVLETASKISKHHRLYVIVCAIADVTRFQMMNLYNIGGLSSSLQQIPSKPFYKDYVNIDARKDRKRLCFRTSILHAHAHSLLRNHTHIHMLLCHIPYSYYSLVNPDIYIDNPT